MSNWEDILPRLLLGAQAELKLKMVCKLKKGNALMSLAVLS